MLHGSRDLLAKPSVKLVGRVAVLEPVFGRGRVFASLFAQIRTPQWLRNGTGLKHAGDKALAAATVLVGLSLNVSLPRHSCFSKDGGLHSPLTC